MRYNFKHKVRGKYDIIDRKFESFETQNDLFLTIFGQNQANLRMARNQKDL